MNNPSANKIDALAKELGEIGHADVRRILEIVAFCMRIGYVTELNRMMIDWIENKTESARAKIKEMR